MFRDRGRLAPRRRSVRALARDIAGRVLGKKKERRKSEERGNIPPAAMNDSPGTLLLRHNKRRRPLRKAGSRVFTQLVRPPPVPAASISLYLYLPYPGDHLAYATEELRNGERGGEEMELPWRIHLAKRTTRFGPVNPSIPGVPGGVRCLILVPPLLRPRVCAGNSSPSQNYILGVPRNSGAGRASRETGEGPRQKSPLALDEREGGGCASFDQ